MENKMQELTDKIYREGVEKGNEEAQRLIANKMCIRDRYNLLYMFIYM